MNIYFAGSIRGGRQDKDLYLQIIKLLEAYGTVLTEHVADPSLTSEGEDGPSDQYIYERDMNWLSSADVLVAEVTTPSLGVGYELGKAEGKIPVLCLYRPQEGKRLSAMIMGCEGFTVSTYRTFSEVESIVQKFFHGLRAAG